MAYLALGVRLIRKFQPSETFYCGLAFLTTYLTYVAYHMAKRPIAVVESSESFLDCKENETKVINECVSWVNEMNGDKDKSEEIISNMQVFYAAFYAGFMFINGMLAERYSRGVYKFIFIGNL